jgi:hypothetical protein
MRVQCWRSRWTCICFRATGPPLPWVHVLACKTGPVHGPVFGPEIDRFPSRVLVVVRTDTDRSGDRLPRALQLCRADRLPKLRDR